MRGAVVAALAALAGACGHAEAQVTQVKLGLAAHNTPVWGDRRAEDEGGVNFSAQLNFQPIAALSFIGAPRPYLFASLNSDGNTNFGGGGLAWRVPLAGAWAIEPGLGYVVHDGATENPFASADPRAPAYSRENLLLGSQDLWQTSLALSRTLGEKWSAELYWEHLSHGQILGDGRNQGLDNVGLRVGYALGE